MTSVRTVCLLFATACARPLTERAPAAIDVDSVVLERTPCLGTCPAYRLTVARTGLLKFQSGSRDDNCAAQDTLRPSPVDSIASRAEAIGFLDLPDTISRDPLLCRDHA